MATRRLAAKIFEPHAFGGRSGGSVFFVKRFLGAFGLVVCLAVSLTRSVAPEADRLNTYRSDFASVSVGKYQLCLKTKNQDIYCFRPVLTKGQRKRWGNYLPSIPLSRRVESVIHTGYNVCTTDMVDALKCGGLNDRRQLGRNVRYEYLSNTFLPEAVTDVAGAGDHLCAVVEGQARCWAGNSYAQSTGNTSSPPGDVYPEDSRPVALPEKADTVTASEGSSCARGASGSVYCWGGIRAPDGAYAPGPARLATDTDIKDMSGKIALTAAGRLVYVETGPYNPATGTVPAALTPLDARGRVVAISGHPHGIDCWVTATGAAYCLNTDKQTVQIAQE